MPAKVNLCCQLDLEPFKVTSTWWRMWGRRSFQISESNRSGLQWPLSAQTTVSGQTHPKKTVVSFLGQILFETVAVVVGVSKIEIAVRAHGHGPNPAQLTVKEYLLSNHPPSSGSTAIWFDNDSPKLVALL